MHEPQTCFECRRGTHVELLHPTELQDTIKVRLRHTIYMDHFFKIYNLWCLAPFNWILVVVDAQVKKVTYRPLLHPRPKNNRSF